MISIPEKKTLQLNIMYVTMAPPKEDETLHRNQKALGTPLHDHVLKHMWNQSSGEAKHYERGDISNHEPKKTKITTLFNNSSPLRHPVAPFWRVTHI